MTIFLKAICFVIISSLLFIHVHSENSNEEIKNSFETHPTENFQGVLKQFNEIKEKNKFHTSYLNTLYNWYLRAYGGMPHDLRRKIKRLLKWTNSEEELNYKNMMEKIYGKDYKPDPRKANRPFPHEIEEFNVLDDMS